MWDIILDRDVQLGVVVLEAVEVFAGSDPDAEFFAEFPAERILCGFTLCQFAAGKFPEFPHGICLRPIRNQQPSVRIDQIPFQ